MLVELQGGVGVVDESEAKVGVLWWSCSCSGDVNNKEAALQVMQLQVGMNWWWLQLWQSVQVAAEHCCSGKCRMGMSWADEQLKWLWGDAGYVCKTAGGSCVIITGNPRKIARMNMEFRMDGLCKNGYAA